MKRDKRTKIVYDQGYEVIFAGRSNAGVLWHNHNLVNQPNGDLHLIQKKPNAEFALVCVKLLPTFFVK
jgi:GTP-binding protein EngB required for normal cell division